MEDRNKPRVEVPTVGRSGRRRFPDAIVAAVSGLLIIAFGGLSLIFVLHEMVMAA